MDCSNCFHYAACHRKGREIPAKGCATFVDVGLCVVLPCKPGDTVYTIAEDYFDCDNCEHKDDARYDETAKCMCCDLPDGRHCPYRIREHVVEGFNIGTNRETGKLHLSDPGEWGYEGLETFGGVGNHWYLTRAEAEAALGGGGDG